MAYDVARARTIVWGGHASDPLVWEWNGTTWSGVTAIGAAPPLRHTFAMTDVPGDGVMIVAGDAAGTTVGDTWIWDGASWTEVSEVTAPGARIGHAMTYDAERREVVLFGGANGTTRLGDTWTWTRAGGWVLRSPAVAPPARSRATMTWDPIRRRVLLIGGLIGSARVDETWAWDGTTWTRVFTNRRPPGLVEPAAAFDAVAGAVIAHALGGTFRLQWRGPGVDDVCRTAIDRDGDGLDGCDELDCWATCTPDCPPATSCPS